MKTFVKVGLGALAGALVGFGVAFLGKNHENDEDLVMVDEEIENDDSDSDEEAE